MPADRAHGPRIVRSAFGAFAAFSALAAFSAPASAQDVRHPMPAHEMEWGRATFLLSEVLELAPDAASRPISYDLLGWTGGPVHRVWFKAEGVAATRGQGAEGAYQILYGRQVSPFWDLQLGARADLHTFAGRTESRVGVALGVQGLAPGWFELEPELFVSSAGLVIFQVTGSHDLYVTQRLVLQPRADVRLAASDDAALGQGSGLSHGALALRLRYELRREFAPYVGVLWERRFGRTADFARTAGGDAGETQLVLGLRLWH
ncbi:MAG: copper resistance protein B [Gemmatimonadota bacterium]|nr:copper resistance protein B [Gemmatimonadota bacterium]